MKTILYYLPILILASIGTVCSQNYSGGKGTAENPYQISTLEDLRYLSEKGESDWDKHFILMNDIDARDTKNWNPETIDYTNESGIPWDYDSLRGFQPIAPYKDKPFRGSFDGQGYSISNLYIYRTGMVACLIGYAVDSDIKNLGIEDCRYTTWGEHVNMGWDKIMIAKASAGLIVYNAGTIDNCYATGEIISYGNVAYDSTGGLVVHNMGTITNSYSKCKLDIFASAGGFVHTNHGVISKCYVEARIETYSTDNMMAGPAGISAGFVINNTGDISQCFAFAPVHGKVKGAGFVGRNSGRIENCYTRRNVNTLEYLTDQTVAGFSMNNTGDIINCYAANSLETAENDFGSTMSVYIYGFGDKDGTNCFFDSTLAGKVEYNSGIGKSTNDMHDINTFLDVGWDFENIWNINPDINGGYPYLFNSLVGIEDEAEQKSENLTIYPNPAQNHITINHDGIIENIEIYDMTGKLMLTANRNEIDISILPNGIYQVVLKNRFNIENAKLIINR